MEVKIIVQSKQLCKGELRRLLQAIRDCEQKCFPDKEIAIWIEAPELTSVECAEILASVKPPFKYGPVNVDLEEEIEKMRGRRLW